MVHSLRDKFNKQFAFAFFLLIKTIVFSSSNYQYSVRILDSLDSPFPVSST